METRSAHLKNLRALIADELDTKVSDLKKDMFTLRFQLVTGRIENPAKIRHTRREIARAKTILSEKARVTAGERWEKGT